MFLVAVLCGRVELKGDGHRMMGKTAVPEKRWALSVLSRTIIACAGLAASATYGFSPVQARELVTFDKPHSVGSIIIDTAQRRLYYVLGHGMALRYSVAVGKEGMQWSGETFVQSKRVDPGWSPTARMRREDPRLPAYVPPGPKNPLGVRAIYLGWSEYRIHGTNMPWSIGRASSSGCIRMLNSDVVDLYERVHIGAPVIVLR